MAIHWVKNTKNGMGTQSHSAAKDVHGLAQGSLVVPGS